MGVWILFDLSLISENIKQLYSQANTKTIWRDSNSQFSRYKHAVIITLL